MIDPTVIKTDQFTVGSDRSVWSSRYARVIHAPCLVEGQTGIDAIVRKERNGSYHFLPAGQAASVRLLLLGFGIGADLLAAIEFLAATNPSVGSAPHTITLCEKFPPSRHELRKLWADLGIEGALANELVAQWPAPSRSMHRLSLANLQSGQAAIELTLAYGNPERSLAELSGPFDAVLLANTAGGLSSEPESQSGLRQLRRLSHKQTRITGFSSAEHLQQPLQALGLETHADSLGWLGYWRKFVFSRSQSRQPARTHESSRASRTAIVLGAGIAGLTIARELSALGMTVTVLEQNNEALLGGSAQPVLAGHLHFSSDDNLLARLTRAAQALQARLQVTQTIGRLQLLPDSNAAAAAQLMLEELALPIELVRIVQAEEASEIAGLRIAQSALWQASTGILSPHLLARQLPTGVQVKTGVKIKHMSRDRGEWSIFDQQDTVIGRAETVVLCTGSMPLAASKPGVSGTPLLPAASIQTSLVAGQTTCLADRLSPKLRCIIGADNYACPLADGSVLTGASYRHNITESGTLPIALTDEDLQANLNGWHKLTRGEHENIDINANKRTQILGNFGGVRHTTSDHLPLIGPVADEQAAARQWEALHRDDRLSLPLLPGIFMAGGFGSRGALWSALAAVVLRDLISGSQAPIERSLIAAIAPHRFLKKRIRRYRTPDACNMASAANSPNEGHATRTAHD